MATYETFDWYDEAHCYDIVFGTGTATEADFLEAAAARYILPGGGSARRRALEPACGTGRILLELAKRGWSVTGFDLSAGSLRYARRRFRGEGCRGRFFRAAMQDFTVAGPFDLAFCLVSTFKYLLSDRDAIAHLRGVARALAPGGIYVLGLHLTDYRDRSPGFERWRAARDGLRITCTIGGPAADPVSRTEDLFARLTIRGNGAVRRLESTWRFRTYGPRQLRTVLRAVPELEHVATHDFDYRINRLSTFGGDRLDHVLILRRRG